MLLLSGWRIEWIERIGLVEDRSPIVYCIDVLGLIFYFIDFLYRDDFFENEKNFSWKLLVILKSL